MLSGLKVFPGFKVCSPQLLHVCDTHGPSTKLIIHKKISGRFVLSESMKRRTSNKKHQYKEPAKRSLRIRQVVYRLNVWVVPQKSLRPSVCPNVSV